MSASTSQAVTVRSGWVKHRCYKLHSERVNNLKAPHVTGELVRRMEALSFFDEEVTRDLLFVSVHDAILYIQLETFSGDLFADKVKNVFHQSALNLNVKKCDKTLFL